jgi:hypothetical protein
MTIIGGFLFQDREPGAAGNAGYGQVLDFFKNASIYDISFRETAP